MENAQLVDDIFTSMTVFLGTIAAGDADPGRSGRDEHHAGFGDRADAGNRPAQGRGRHRRRILADFLLEGVLLAVFSGSAGWLAAYLIAAAVNRLPKQEMFGGLPVDGQTTALAFGALGIVAVASAIWPAWRAAGLTPVEALRYER